MNILFKTFFLFFFIVFTNLNANTDVTLQLSWKNQFQFAGYYIAKEKGFYKEFGLDVKIKEFDNGVDITNDVVSGKVDFGVGRSSLIHDRYNDKPIVMLAAIFQHSPVVLLTKKRDDIVKIEDLKNKKIMLTTDQVAMASINAMLQTHKITPQMYTTQQHSFNVQDLIDGKTDVMLSYISNEPYTMQEQNIPYTIFSPKDYNFDFYSDILFTSEDLLLKNPQLVKDFREATLKGWEYALEHQEEAVELILTKYNTQNKTKGSLLYESDAISKLVDKDKVELGNIDTKKIEYITQIFSLLGLIKNQKTIENLVYKVEKVSDKNDLKFTSEEKSWLLKHPNIILGADQDWQPFDFKDSLGEHGGFNADFINLISKKLGIDIKVELGAWDELQQKVKNKTLSGLIGVYKTDERDTYMEFTKPYFVLAQVVLVQKDAASITSFNDLDNKTIALKLGGSDIEYFKTKYPKIKQKIYNSNAEVIRAVSLGEVDAGASNIGAASYEMERNFISNIKIGYEITDLSGDMRLGIRKDWPQLASILQKGMDAITREEINVILNKWLKLSVKNDNVPELDLSKEEKEWIKKKTPIKYVYDPDWAPFEWKNELGHHTGIVADIINLIAERSGINFTSLPVDSWENAMQKAKNKDADMYSAITENNDILKYMDFTKKDLFNAPFAFVTRANDKSDYFNIFDALAGKKIAVVKGYHIENMITNDRPDINLITVKNMTEGFQKLRDGEIDVFCQDIVTAKRFINVEGYDDLRIAAKTDYTFELKIAIRNDWPKEVISIINKSLDTVTKKEIDDIYNKWTNITYKETVDYSLIWKILVVVVVVILIFVYSNRKLQIIVNKKTNELKEVLKSLEIKVQKRTEELNEQKEFVQTLLDSQEQIVITTDGKTLRSANKKFLKFFAIKNIDEFRKDYNCICEKFVADETGTYLQKYMQDISWIEYVLQNTNKNHKVAILENDIEHIFSVTAAIMPIEDGSVKSAVFTDITELERAKEEVEQILANILLPVLITSKKDRKILYANKYAESQYDKTIDEIIGSDIDSVYTVKGQHYHIVEAIKKYGRVENMEEIFKTSSGKEFTALLSVTPIRYKNEDSYIGMITDITKQKNMENEVRAIHKHTRESIEYASLIQHALIPSNDLFRKYFSDYLTIWHPKDIVGGDIYLFEELRDDNECLLMVIDCTGHGVPGAFVTMLVKAIERQITSNIINSDEMVSPSKILSIFNRNMKYLLKQENKESISNAGFDGGIIYYNKKDKIVKYSGAETPLFYIEDGELKTIKGSRQSVGYKKSDADFEFKEYTIEVKEGMQFYLSTDGYLDQNGGDKGFPFGKKRFSKILEENYSLPFADQQEILLYDMQDYQANEERNDDVTIVGIKI